MKRRNKKYFTLIELLFVIAILVILIGISWVAGTKVLRNQTEKKTKAEIFLLTNAVKQYKDRFGEFPATSDTEVKFAAYLSKVQPNTAGWSGKRPMFIDYKQADFFVGTKSGSSYTIDYDEVDENTVNDDIYALDPYENPYFFRVNTTTNSFIIYSAGLDGNAESASSGTGTQADPFTTTGDDVGSDNL